MLILRRFLIVPPAQPRTPLGVRRREEGFVIAEVAGRQRRRQPQQQVLGVVVDQACAAGVIGVHRLRRIGRHLTQDAQTGGLQQPPDRPRRVEVDVPDTVRRIVLRATADVLGRHLHEHVPRHARGFGQELARVLEVLDDMAQDGEIERRVVPGQVSTVEQPAFDEARNPAPLDDVDPGA